MRRKAEGGDSLRGTVRARLMRSARRLGAREGLSALSVRGVVRDAGTNLNSVHYHFGSRESLIEELAGEALEALNSERFDRFDVLVDAPAGRVGVRQVLAAAYTPLFEQALAARRAERREGLLVVQQLRFDPSGVGQRVLDEHAREFVARVEGLLGPRLALTAGQLRERMQCVNATAWDLALRPDTLARVARTRRPGRTLDRIVAGFLDFAVGGLRAEPA